MWGTFSVRDHCNPSAFVSEVMLYDRLVIPVPPNEDERTRWRDAGWNPELLEKLLPILGDRARVVYWDSAKQDQWKNKYETGKTIAHDTGEWAFQATRTVLVEGLPTQVTGIQAIANYTDVSELERDLLLAPAPVGAPLSYGGAAVAVMGHEFFMPNDPRWTHEELLKEAVVISSEQVSRRKRANFWRWQREFMNGRGIIDQNGLTQSVEEMRDLIEEERHSIRKSHIRTGTMFAFMVGSVALGLLGGPLTPVAIGSAFMSVGQFFADRLLREPETNDKPVSLVWDIRKHFGWN